MQAMAPLQQASPTHLALLGNTQRPTPPTHCREPCPAHLASQLSDAGIQLRSSVHQRRQQRPHRGGSAVLAAAATAAAAGQHQRPQQDHRGGEDGHHLVCERARQQVAQRAQRPCVTLQPSAQSAAAAAQLTSQVLQCGGPKLPLLAEQAAREELPDHLRQVICLLGIRRGQGLRRWQV